MQRFICFVAIAILLSSRLSYAANFAFSGGNGTPVTVTIAAPISYLVTAADNGFFSFVIKGAGNPLNDAFPSATGTLQYSVNGGASQTLNMLNSGFVGGSYAENDFYLFKSPTNLSVVPGNVVTLSAGALTTTTSFTAAAPISGDYTTYLYLNANGGATGNSQISNAGTQTPEPATLSALGVIGLLAAARRHRLTRTV